MLSPCLAKSFPKQTSFRKIFGGTSAVELGFDGVILFKCKDVIKGALRSEAVLGRALVAKGHEIVSGTPNREGNTVMPLSVCPLTTAGTSLCFLSVYFAASPLNFLCHPGCFPELRLSGLVCLQSPPVPLKRKGIKSRCHGKGYLLPIAPGSTAG